MFERKWENQSEAMKCQLAYGMCTARRVTVSAAYLYQLEQREAFLAQAEFTREDAELLTTEIERLERAKAEAGGELMYATRNRRRAEKRAAAAVAECDAMRAQVAELKAMVRAMREAVPQAAERGKAQDTQAEPLRWAVADEKPSRWDYLEVGR